MPRRSTLDAVIAAIAQDMTANPRELKPGALCRLLNSTPLGPVLTDRRLRAHRETAGMRIGDGRTVDLLRYAAWLFHARREAPPATAPPAGEDRYAAKKARERERGARISRAGRNIGPPPPVADPPRRAEGVRSLRRFCELYFPDRFGMAWSDDHLTVLDRLEQATLNGGRFALAMPRGSGKTTLCECAALWATMTGRIPFVMLLGASADAAGELLDSLKTELESNDLLAADFPEVCHPIAELEGIPQRAKGQHIDGQRTHVVWGKRTIVFPTVAGSSASGAVLRVGGLLGRVRGQKFTRADGRTVRPKLVIIDDPQTDASARSPLQCAQRERVMSGAVLGLAGPGETIAAVCPCTVIQAGDMADNLLDREKHPAWQGLRTKLLYAFPTAEKLWAEYAELRRAGLAAGGDGREATEFYRRQREAMDAGARPAWPARFLPAELSAVQHAMNLFIDNEEAFFAEYQNEPRSESSEEEELLSAEAIAGKRNGLARGTAPLDATHVTAMIDVQQKCLFWLAAAWSDDFTGAALDYGTFPEQDQRHFSLRNLRRTLAKKFPKAGIEGSLYQGLAGLTDYLFAREWRREDGTLLHLERCLIDVGWKDDVVYRFCRESQHSARLLPAKGMPLGPAERPMDEYQRRPGETKGFHWHLSSGKKGAGRRLLVDVNFWKSFVHARLGQTHGDRGSLSLFGGPGSDHRLLSEHLTAEFRVRTEARGRVVDQWKLKPGRPDNHWFDCLVGTAAAASLLGCQAAVPGRAPAAKPTPRRRRRVDYL